MTEFKPWPKINRINETPMVTITEKIDGTNAAVIIEGNKLVGCQSRKRFIVPGDDNMGFAHWAHANADMLAEVLGDGYHYGEWAGPGIQANPHKFDVKTFFLFRTDRDVTPFNTVPLLYQGAFSEKLINDVMDSLALSAWERSYKPEGIIVYWHEFRTCSKCTFEHSEGKWKNGIQGGEVPAAQSAAPAAYLT